MASLAPNPHVHDRKTSMSPIRPVMESFGAHDHICLIYETREEQLAAVVPFLKIGLKRGEKCLYIVDENTPEIITAALKEDGVDTDAVFASGALTIVDTKQAYLKNRDFDPDRMIAYLKEGIDAAEAEGFTSFRITGEITWALRPAKLLDPLIEYECRLNDFFRGHNVVALCQYNRRRFQSETLLHVIHTHPLVACGDLVCENPHYVPPAVFDPKKFDAAAEVQRLLDSIVENARLKRELDAEVQQANLLSAETTRWRQLYEAVLANTPDLGYILDLEHRFTYANGALLAMWGRTWDDAIGKTCLELGYEPWQAARHEREMDQVIATRQPVRGEVPFTGTNGRRIYDYIFFPVIGPTGEVEAVGGNTRDITDLKQTEEALRQSEKRYRELLEALPVAVYATDADGVVTLYNQAAAQFAGRQPEAGKDKWCVSHRLYRPDGTFLPYDECPMAVSLLTGETQRGAEAIAERPDGTRTWFVPYPTLVRDASGKITGGINVLIDIIERKRAEHLLLEQKRILELIATGCSLQECLTAITASVASLHPDVRAAVILANESGEEISRVFSADISPQFEQGLRGAPICELAIGTCGTAIHEGRPVICTDVANDTQWSKPWRDLCVAHGVLACLSTPVFSAANKSVASFFLCFGEPHEPDEWDRGVGEFGAHIAGIAIDRQAARERQKRSEAALSKSEKFAAAGRMAATIAHEINNPLEAIVNLSYLLAQENLSPAARDLVRALDTELDRVSHIAKQTLEFYRSGKTAGPMDIAQPIDAAVELFSRKAESKGVRIQAEYRTSAKIFGFSGELRQVFANLIDNALESGATAIRIRVSPGRDLAHGNRAGVSVAVADNGSGVPGDFTGRLFEPFFTTKEEKGTGLGLWVSKGIIQKHEGWIRVHTSTGPDRRGTTFCIFLPTLHEEPPSRQSG